MAEPTNHLHGRFGVFCGGDWIPMEECESRWNNDIEDLGGDCSANRRAELPEDEYDVVIVGAGCVGCSVARELSRFCLKVLVVEKADDVTQGATKGNSGIVHAGYDDAPGSVRAKFCPVGNRMFPQLDRELKFGFQRNGSLVVARGPEDYAILEDLVKRGKQNDVRGLRILDQAELRRVEPNVAPDATGALFAPSAGIVIPFEFTIALAENAANNGVEFRCQREVTSFTKEAEGGYTVTANRWARASSFDKSHLAYLAVLLAVVFAVLAAITPPSAKEDGVVLTVPQMVALAATAALFFLFEQFYVCAGGVIAKETVKARYVVNAAGVFSDKVAAMVGDESFKMKPRLGEYLLMRRPAITSAEEPPLCRHIVFPCPGKMGKGVLVQPTLWGNLCLGPTAVDTLKRDPVWRGESARGESKASVIKEILSKVCLILSSILSVCPQLIKRSYQSARRSCQESSPTTAATSSTRSPACAPRRTAGTGSWSRALAPAAGWFTLQASIRLA